MKPLVIAPSILSADFGCLAREVKAVATSRGPANALVAGSAVFGSPDYAHAIALLRSHAAPPSLPWDSSYCDEGACPLVTSGADALVSRMANMRPTGPKVS